MASSSDELSASGNEFPDAVSDSSAISGPDSDSYGSRSSSASSSEDNRGNEDNTGNDGGPGPSGDGENQRGRGRGRGPPLPKRQKTAVQDNFKWRKLENQPFSQQDWLPNYEEETGPQFNYTNFAPIDFFRLFLLYVLFLQFATFHNKIT